MSIWLDRGVEATVLDVLEAVHTPENHHFGRPYLTAYQLATVVQQRDPGLAEALGVPFGGAGAGQERSLVSYLALELSKHGRADPNYPVEGAFVSNDNVLDMVFRGPNESEVHSSASEAGWPLALFRLRAATTGSDTFIQE